MESHIARYDEVFFSFLLLRKRKLRLPLLLVLEPNSLPILSLPLFQFLTYTSLKPPALASLVRNRTLCLLLSASSPSLEEVLPGLKLRVGICDAIGKWHAAVVWYSGRVCDTERVRSRARNFPKEWICKIQSTAKAGFLRSLLPVIALVSNFRESGVLRGLGIVENWFGSAAGSAAALVTQHLILSADSPGQTPLYR